jgi:hypothetical protein
MAGMMLVCTISGKLLRHQTRVASSLIVVSSPSLPLSLSLLPPSLVGAVGYKEGLEGLPLHHIRGGTTIVRSTFGSWDIT